MTDEQYKQAGFNRSIKRELEATIKELELLPVNAIPVVIQIAKCNEESHFYISSHLLPFMIDGLKTALEKYTKNFEEL